MVERCDAGAARCIRDRIDFTLFGRLNRFILPTRNYERSVWPRRAASSFLATLDYFLLRLPGINRLGGTAVICGHAAK